MVLTWVSGFDIIYALQDDEFDREAGLYSIPAVMSRRSALIISVLLHVVSALLVAAAGLAGDGRCHILDRRNPLPRSSCISAFHCQAR
ncbi:MAG: hypothetical protein MZV63_05805 [Marinilabiliales bacterium]|nr:hypothetical protein [Marinilabiliales bacterium]